MVTARCALNAEPGWLPNPQEQTLPKNTLQSQFVRRIGWGPFIGGCCGRLMPFGLSHFQVGEDSKFALFGPAHFHRGFCGLLKSPFIVFTLIFFYILSIQALLLFIWCVRTSLLDDISNR